MFNIGIISEYAVLDLQIEEELKNLDCHVKMLNTDELEAEMIDLDAIIIRNDEEGDILSTYELIMRIKSNGDPYVWIVSKEYERINRLIYLQLGADGSFDSDFFPTELVYHINNIKRRQQMQMMNAGRGEHRPNKLLVTSGKKLLLNNDNLSVIINGKGEFSLTKLEFRLMKYLEQNVGKTVTYEEIYSRVWEKAYSGEKHRIANLIFHIREKIEEDPARPQYVKTVRSRGYLLKK